MTRTLLAAFLATCGMTSAVSAQMYYHGPGYTSYYAPASYSSYSYTSGYGPLGIFSPRAWFGGPTAYTSPFYGSTAYTAGYAPAYTAAYTPSYTASYSPIVTTSYYAPSVDMTAAVVSPTVLASNACCTPCCASCTPCSSCGLACASCASGNCPGGNCSLNYAPTSGVLKPEPDPNVSGSSGSRTFESESNGGTKSNSGANEPDSFEPYDRNRPSDGFGEERGAGYRPESKIEQKAPAAVETDEAEKEAAPAEAETPAGGLNAPAAEETPEAHFLDLDTRITSAPSLLRDRTRMSARFGSPKLARAKVDPATIPGASELRLVKK